MRLNIRLIGLIFGIMALAIIGRILLLTSRGRSSGRSDSRGGLVLLGLGVIVLGLVGAFFGQADHGGGVSAARVPGRRQRRPVHGQPRRH